MKILIDIPKEFEVDYNTDRFAEFFQRFRADMGTCCGNYEQETAVMMEKAFTESKIYDPDKVVEQLYKLRQYGNKYDEYYDNAMYKIREYEKDIVNSAIDKAIEIVKAGGADAEH